MNDLVFISTSSWNQSNQFFLLHWKRSLFLWVPDEVIYNYLKFSCWKTTINVVLVICWICIQFNFHKSNATGVFLLKDKKYRPSKIKQGFPGGASGKELTCQCRRHRRLRFDPWFGKIPWRKKWQPTSTLAWRIPWTEEPGGLQSMESWRVRHDWATEHTWAHITDTSLQSPPLSSESLLLIRVSVILDLGAHSNPVRIHYN